MSPSPSSHGRTVVTGRAAARLGPRPLAHAERARAPAPQQLAELHRRLLADDHVQLVAGLHDGRAARRDRPLPAHHHVEQRLARSPSSRTGWPTTASPSRTGNWITSAPSRLSSTGSTSGADRGLVGLHPEQPRDGLDRRPLQRGREQHDEERDVEDRQPAVDALRHREGREHDRDRAAQAGPAEHEPLPPRRTPPDGHDERRQRAREDRGGEGDRGALERDGPEVLGEHEQAEDQEQRELGDPGRPSWKVTIVRRAGVVAVPSTSPAR